MDDLNFVDVVDPPANFCDLPLKIDIELVEFTRQNMRLPSQSPEIQTDNVWDSKNCPSNNEATTSTPIISDKLIEKLVFANFPDVDIQPPSSPSNETTFVVNSKGRGMKVARSEPTSSPVQFFNCSNVNGILKSRPGLGRASSLSLPPISLSELNGSQINGTLNFLPGVGRKSPISFSTEPNEKREESLEFIPPPAKYADTPSSETVLTTENTLILRENDACCEETNSSTGKETRYLDNSFGSVRVYEVISTFILPQIGRIAQKPFSSNDSDSGSSTSDTSWNVYHADFKLNRPHNRYIDTHCHLDLIYKRENFCDYTTFKKKYSSTWSPSYAGCITDFCFPDQYTADKSNFWDTMLANDNVWAAIGCHPKHASDYNDVVDAFIEDKCQHPKVVAVGELGLDYSGNKRSESDKQARILDRQLDMGVRRLGKPLLLHCRDAAEDCLKIFKSKVPHDHPIHFHCFTYGVDVFEEWSNYFTNCYFGVTPGVFTPKTVEQENFYKKVPLNKILIETDAPYFLPPAYRTKKYGSLESSHPGMGALVAVKLAELKKEDLGVVFDVILQNTKKLYKISL